MSGGSMNYFYAQLEEYASCLKDKELVELAEDMARLFHDREWHDSGDIGEGGWNRSVAEFKKKWFTEPREERLKRYIDEAVSDLKVSLGIGNFCKDCALFTLQDDGYYGRCPHQKNVLVHGYEKSCGCFGRKDGVVILPKEEMQK